MNRTIPCKKNFLYRIMISIQIIICCIVFSHAEEEIVGENKPVTEMPKEKNEENSNVNKKEKKYLHAINSYPLGIVLGDILLNYEFFWAQKHGIILEGNYTFPEKIKGYGFGIQYHQHFFKKKKHYGINSPFWGLFYKQAKAKGEIEENINNVKSKYKYDVSMQAIGANIGRRWVFGEIFNLQVRIGYGFPIVKYKWNNGEPENVKIIESISKVAMGIDGEVTIGFVF